MKKRDFFRKFSQSKDPLQEDYTNITIKKDKKRLWIKSALKLFIIVFISSMLGVFLSVYLITSKYIDKIIEIKHPNAEITQNTTKTISHINDVVKNVAQSIVTIGPNENELAIGMENKSNVSGFIIRSDGYILTSYSAVDNFNEIYVKLPSSGTMPFKGKLIGKDKLSDLAIIKIEAEDLPKVKFGNYSSIKVGDVVIAVGNVTSTEFVGSATAGIVTSLNKKIRLAEEQQTEGYLYTVLETDTIINSDNNGGVLCNLEGEVIGINSLYLSGEYASDSLNCSINIDEVQKLIESILSYKEVSKVSLGVDGATLIGEEDLKISGVYVENVIEGGSAAVAGIRPTDIIVEFDNIEIKKIEDIMDILNSHQPGDIVKCKVVRGQLITEIMVTLQEKK